MANDSFNPEKMDKGYSRIQQDLRDAIFTPGSYAFIQMQNKILDSERLTVMIVESIVRMVVQLIAIENKEQEAKKEMRQLKAKADEDKLERIILDSEREAQTKQIVKEKMPEEKQLTVEAVTKIRDEATKKLAEVKVNLGELCQKRDALTDNMKEVEREWQAVKEKQHNEVLAQVKEPYHYFDGTTFVELPATDERVKQLVNNADRLPSEKLLNALLHDAQLAQAESATTIKTSAAPEGQALPPIPPPPPPLPSNSQMAEKGVINAALVRAFAGMHDPTKILQGMRLNKPVDKKIVANDIASLPEREKAIKTIQEKFLDKKGCMAEIVNMENEEKAQEHIVKRCDAILEHMSKKVEDTQISTNEPMSKKMEDAQTSTNEPGSPRPGRGFSS